MKYKVLATGSKGNCVVLADSIAIDIGVPYKLIAPYSASLQIVLVTHAHL